MNKDTFWTIIETARKKARGDQEQMLEALDEALQSLKPEKIACFQAELDQRMVEANSWPLWGAAYIMNGGCSDDGFEYFRAFLIANGRAVFENALKDPESLASAKLAFGDEYEWEFESLIYAPAQAHEAVAGTDVPRGDFPLTDPPSGTRWDEETVDELFPKLVKKFAADEDDDDED